MAGNPKNDIFAKLERLNEKTTFLYLHKQASLF